MKMNFRKKLYIISFIEGATVMATEITGAKLLAPFFGSSLYVWASILAITLGGLACGYFLGGKLSKKENKQNTLAFILVLAFCFLIGMTLSNNFIFFTANYLTVIPSVIISAFIIIFPSMLLMGTSSPLIISLLTNSADDSGLNSGKIFATSTVGGIFSTFLCGFYLIPNIGISFTIICFALLIGLASFLLIEKKNTKLIPVFIIVLASFLFLSLNRTSKTKNTIYTKDGILGKLDVKDETQNDSVCFRKLLINNIVQSEMDLKTKKSLSEYIQYLEINLHHLKKGNALVLGLGGGLVSNMLYQNGFRVTGVEFDERIIEIAKKYFFLDTSIQTICNDARLYINNSDKKFDLIVFDIFKAEEQPSHILTLESITKLKKLLTPNAVIVINTHGYLEGDLGLGNQCLLATLKKSGFHLKVCAKKCDPNFRNALVFASTNKLNYTLINEIPLLKIQNPEIVNTDNAPILEKLNAEASKTWRLHYLKNYILNN